MINEIQIISQQLLKQNIKPSYPRIRIYQYLLGKTHPNAEEVYQALINEIPSLSKTTVYTSLNLMSQKKMIRSINIEENETRYDVNPAFHGHFKCTACGMIFDFVVNDKFEESNTLPGFHIEDKNFYCKGLCPRCQATAENEL